MILSNLVLITKITEIPMNLSHGMNYKLKHCYEQTRDKCNNIDETQKHNAM